MNSKKIVDELNKSLKDINGFLLTAADVSYHLPYPYSGICQDIEIALSAITEAISKLSE